VTRIFVTRTKEEDVQVVLLVTTTHQVQVLGRMNLFNSVRVCGNFECFIVLLKS
jgi:hypothetical protein